MVNYTKECPYGKAESAVAFCKVLLSTVWLKIGMLHFIMGFTMYGNSKQRCYASCIRGCESFLSFL